MPNVQFWQLPQVTGDFFLSGSIAVYGVGALKNTTATTLKSEREEIIKNTPSPATAALANLSLHPLYVLSIFDSCRTTSSLKLPSLENMEATTIVR